MARIEPIPFEQLPERSRQMIEQGQATGMYTTPVPMQIVAHSSMVLEAMHVQYTATFGKGLLEPRLVELIRLRSAIAGACGPCSVSRKDPSVTEEDVACLLAPNPDHFTRREYLALCLFDLLATDHHAINDETFRELAEVFSVAEIIEVGYLASTSLGGHRFMHTLGMLEVSQPLFPYDPAAIDRPAAQPSSVG